MRQRLLRFALMAGFGSLLAVGGFTSCSNQSSVSPQTGTLRMALIDAPAASQSVDSLVVVFKKVLVHRSADATLSDGGWSVLLPDTLAVEKRTFDLLQLVNGAFAPLGEVVLPTGHYTQVRIMLQSATLYVGGVPQDLTIPSGDQTGIKLVGSFTINPDVVTQIVADFEVARSLHESPPGSGNYILRPTIRLVQTTLSGSISGTVTPTGIGAALFALSPTTGDTLSTTMADPDTGAYMLQALLAGSYDVRAEAPGYVDSTRTGISVTAGANTPNVDFALVPTGP